LAEAPDMQRTTKVEPRDDRGAQIVFATRAINQ